MGKTKELLHFKSYLTLGSSYKKVVENLEKYSEHDAAFYKYIHDPSFFGKDGKRKHIWYMSERIFPRKTDNRIPVVLLFSNPHPKSILSGIFLPGVHWFWNSMQDSEMFLFSTQTSYRYFPEQMMNKLLNLEYDSPFAFYFYCFFDFPSNQPGQLKELFNDFFQQYLNRAFKQLACFLDKCKSVHLICFGQQAFKYISQYRAEKMGKDIKNYTRDLNSKTFICSSINKQVLNMRQNIKLYLTYPAGCGKYERIKSLTKIKKVICQYEKYH